MGVLGQATGNINPQISCTGNSFQDLTMEIVICIYRFPGPCHLNNLALRGVEFDVSVPLPHRQFVKVVLQGCAVILTFNGCIIREQSQFGSYPSQVDEEQDWPKNRAPGYTRADWHRIRFLTTEICYYGRLGPRQDIRSNTILV